MADLDIIGAIRHELMGELSEKALGTIKRYQRAVNYLSAGQIYLKSNPLLREPLCPDNIKDRLLGHWGTVPGINLIYSHLNRLILRTGAEILLITGPGHGAAANLANMYVEDELETIVLSCCCSPLPCHGDVVRNAILYIAGNLHEGG